MFWPVYPLNRILEVRSQITHVILLDIAKFLLQRVLTFLCSHHQCMTLFSYVPWPVDCHQILEFFATLIDDK